MCTLQHVWMVLFVALNFLTECSAARVCTTYCSSGHYCHGDDCNLCPDRNYQGKEHHQETECIPWSPKPEYGEWDLEQEGNSTNDRVWTCAPGYELRKFTVDGEECRRIPTSTTPSPDGSSPVSLKPTTASSSTTEVMSSPDSSSVKASNNGVIIGCIIGSIALIILVIGVVLFISYRKRKLCFSGQGHETTNGSVTAPLTLDSYFQSLMENNCINKIEILVRSLPHSDYIKEALKSTKRETDEPEKYYAKALGKWAEKYPLLEHRNLIEKILDPDTPC